MVTEGLVFRLEARGGKDTEVEQFLRSAERVVQLDHTTTAWFALRFGLSEYGIINLFSNSAGRDTYLSGQVSRALKERGEAMLSRWPSMQRVTVLAEKLPSMPPAHPITKGLLLSFMAKPGHEQEVENFLREAQPMVLEEQDTLAWVALKFDTGEYGIFDVFADGGARFKHITGHVPREMVKHAFTMFGSFPDMELVNILAAKL
jgi:hypothetical protein